MEKTNTTPTEKETSERLQSKFDTLKIGVIGGDRRQLAMAEKLAAYGEVAVAGFEHYDGEVLLPTRCMDAQTAICRAQVVILPLPFSPDGVRVYCPLGEEIKLETVLGELRPNQTVIGGKLNESLRAYAERIGFTLYDLCEREDFNIANAVPTAEGAVQIAMEHLPITVHGACCTVLGYGRIGRISARMFADLGAEVSVVARKDADLAWIRASGYRAYPLSALKHAVSHANLVLNTVPLVLLDREILQAMPRDTLIIDLASKPGGVDRSAASQLGIETVWALSLPGKVAPVTAGHIMADTVLSILHA